MQEFDKLIVAVMMAVAIGLILLAVILGAAAWRAHRNAQLALRHLILIVLVLMALLVASAAFLIVHFQSSA